MFFMFWSVFFEFLQRFGEMAGPPMDKNGHKFVWGFVGGVNWWVGCWRCEEKWKIENEK